jgi:glucose-6-phosphate 1-dehydrogenase
LTITLAKKPSSIFFSFASPTAFWSRSGTGNYIASVQITMAGKFGIEGRGKFYDATGAIRDVVENHMLFGYFGGFTFRIPPLLR